MKGIVITTKNAMRVQEFSAPAYQSIGDAVGGWTEVNAPNYGAACAAFRAYHPDKTEGLLNCSSVYDEEHFKQTEMFTSGNFNRRCHEVITVQREDAVN